MVLDAGGVDSPIPSELAAAVDILSPNETELARLTNMPTENFEEISQAVRKCHEMVIPRNPLSKNVSNFHLHYF